MIRRTSPELDNWISQDVFKTFAFNQIVSVDRTVYLAGIPATVGGMEDLRIEHPNDLEGQLRFILNKFDELLATEGLDRTSLVAWTLYVTDSSIPEFARLVPEIIGPWVGDHSNAPVSTTVAVPSWIVDGQLIEITAIAVRP
ncbi:enamine deaminase RidA (YjgF/YER057c/UK114 family) [Microbacterium sp. BE35]|uniref:RidA family protein n=1 Tax=Microbacterium sp. BE35 TaxID=2817773 RepID=UPI002867AB51|nr:RidA family protein [Microbacterium sp. BE35]MDR7188183.1 enamine deaminase RidA (YjgF/YER057c/UK114 family) [Microbacterium sp. BE35]